jgi:uncharacterized damage-inducible protein DinB
MTTYALHLESGLQRRKTTAHALDLLGCVAVGLTTDAALAATPDAIRAYLRFLRRHGEPAADPDAPFDTRIAEHVTQGYWLGNGSPYLTFCPDLEPLRDDEIERYLRRFAWMRAELATWAATQSDDQLAASPPDGGRTARAILLHILGATGAYLATALGSGPGFTRLQTAADRGDIPLPDALRRAAALAVERVRAATPEQRAAVREHPTQGARTLHRGLRRMLEHDWEHPAELSRRPGGPPL